MIQLHPHSSLHRFLGSLYTIDIMFQTASVRHRTAYVTHITTFSHVLLQVPATVANADKFLQLLYDP